MSSAAAIARPATRPEKTHKSPKDLFGTASNGKIGMWIFLATDAMSFSGLLLAYGILRGGADRWPDPTHALGIWFTAATTFVLICSSVSMVMALAAAQDGNKQKTLQWLGLTILGGVIFLGGQVYEYTHFIHQGVGLATSPFWSTFFSTTGFHGAHVFTGVCYLSVITFGVSRDWWGRGTANMVEIVGLFWHFVDLVWILVFTLIYLIPVPHELIGPSGLPGH